MINFTVALTSVVIGYASYRFYGQYPYHRTKRLYINEVTCPKCGARPGVGCVGAEYDGLRFPYTCMERWYKVDEENEKREALREAHRKSKRR